MYGLGIRVEGGFCFKSRISVPKIPARRGLDPACASVRCGFFRVYPKSPNKVLGLLLEGAGDLVSWL